EVRFDPTARVLPDVCQGAPGREYGRARDDVCVHVTRQPPAEDRCDGCCDAVPDAREYLARIDGYLPGQPIDPKQIHNEVRRPCAPYDPTRIKAVSWVHGHDYHKHTANKMLREGLTIE